MTWLTEAGAVSGVAAVETAVVAGVVGADVEISREFVEVAEADAEILEEVAEVAEAEELPSLALTLEVASAAIEAGIMVVAVEIVVDAADAVVSVVVETNSKANPWSSALA